MTCIGLHSLQQITWKPPNDNKVLDKEPRVVKIYLHINRALQEKGLLAQSWFRGVNVAEDAVNNMPLVDSQALSLSLSLSL